MGYKMSSTLILLMLVQYSRQFILQEDSSSFPTLTGKRPAWMPQGRMGKRDDELTNDRLNSGGLAALAKKAAWVPQSRFGKRFNAAGQEDFFSNTLRHGTVAMGGEDEEKRIPRMGNLYEKKRDTTFPRMGLKRLSMPRYLTTEQWEKDDEEAATTVERLLSEGGGELAHKRAAWVPQGRFGKRSLEDLLTTQNTVNGVLNGRVTKVMKDPNNPDVRCLTVANKGESTVLCLRMNQDNGKLELLP